MPDSKKTFNFGVGLKEPISQLIIVEPRFEELINLVGLPESRTNDKGFSALFKIIVGQQLSTAAASSIWNNISECGLPNASKLLCADESFLRSLGLSKTKIQYAKGLASSNLDYSKLHKQTNAEVIKTLVALKGIGNWTAEIYLIFSLRRIDVFASGDLALQEATKAFLSLERRPSKEEMETISRKWKPYRTIAALILWKYYGFLKQKKD